VFYAKHLDRTQRPFDLVGTTLEKINAFKDQKKLERDWLKQNPEHKTEPMALDGQRAAMAFDQAVTILRRIWGATGVPLSYVVRHKLVLDQENDNPPCGEAESNYLTYDEEMVARAPILKDFEYDTTNWEEKEKMGPFHPVFLADTKKVWLILHALWSTTRAWTHVKTLDKAQNGRQV